MAMEVPVLATSRGGPSEILGSGVGGVLAPPRDPAAWASRAIDLLENRESTREMAARGRDRVVERFGIDTHVTGVVSAWTEVLRRA